METGEQYIEEKLKKHRTKKWWWDLGEEIENWLEVKVVIGEGGGGGIERWDQQCTTGENNSGY